MYATDGDQWFSYDNPYTMSLKAQYVTDNNFGGVMVGQRAAERPSLKPRATVSIAITHPTRATAAVDGGPG